VRGQETVQEYKPGWHSSESETSKEGSPLFLLFRDPSGSLRAHPIVPPLLATLCSLPEPRAMGFFTPLLGRLSQPHLSVAIQARRTEE